MTVGRGSRGGAGDEERGGASGATKPRGAGAGGTRAALAAPSRAVLHEHALAYLSRSAATADQVTRKLHQRIAAWAKQALARGVEDDGVAEDVARARREVEAVVARLREVGLLNDAAFAESRAKGLSRGGRSRRAIAAHLTARGVAEELVREVAPSGSAELEAALTFARKRRIGPFAREEEDRDARRRALGAMARAGFDHDVAQRALRMDRESAEERLGARGIV